MTHTGEGEVQTSRVKGFLENNPLSVLIGFAIASGGAVAGIMGYYTNQRLEGAENYHKVAVSQLEFKSRKDLVEATEPLKEKILDLTYRLSSIERRVPGTKPDYLDVTSISIGPEQVKELDAKHRPYAGGSFYVSIPDFKGWAFQETSEYEIVKTMYGFVLDELPTSVIDSLKKAKIWLWRGGQNVKLQVKPGNSVLPFENGITLNYFPAVLVQKYDADFIKERTNVAMKMVEDMEESRAKVREVAQKVDELTKSLNGSQNATPLTSVNPVRSDSAHSSQQPGYNDPDIQSVLEISESKRKVVETLGNAYSSDVASFTFTETLMQAAQQGLILGAQHRFSSAQKKANIWYLQDQITVRNASLYLDGKLEDSPRNFVVDSELLFIGYGSGGFLVKIYLPRVENMSENVAWAKSWLVGLRVPLE